MEMIFKKPVRLVHGKRYRVTLTVPMKTVGTFTVLLLGNRYRRNEAWIGFNNKQLLSITKRMVDEGHVIFEERLN